MVDKSNLNLSLEIKHFSIVVVALGIVPHNVVNMPDLEWGCLLHPLVKLQT